MRVKISPKYNPKTEKEYCCVPAVIQMIQGRRGFNYASQDEIGYQLGLIVPTEKARFFTKVRTGSMPKAGWGTQTSKKQFSINKYFERNNLPLKLTKYNPQKIKNISNFIIDNLRDNNDVIICYNSQILFGDGDIEHVSLIQEIEDDKLIIIDPAQKVLKVRKTTVKKLSDTLNLHDISNMGGFWIVKNNN